MRNDLRLVTDEFVADNTERLKSGDGGGTFDGMEARVARLEATVGHIQTDTTDIKAEIRQMKQNARADFLITWGGMIAGFLGMAGLLARGFGWL
jgi:hypothetical protein